MQFNLTPRLEKALRVASNSHDKANHYRKGEFPTPYFVHPFTVMALLTNITDDEDVLIAALLHDTLEDLNPEVISEDDIREKFGENVLNIVKNVSKNPDIKDWREGNIAYLDKLVASKSKQAMMVSLADKTHNLFATLMDYDRIGNEVWEMFRTKNKADQVWFYESLAEVYVEHLPPSNLLDKYLGQIKKLKSL